MEQWLIGVLVVLALVVIGFLIWKILFGPKTTNGFHTHGFRTNGQPPPESRAGYSIWRYRNGVWVMTENHSRPGYVPGPAPTEPGRFPDDLARVTSVRRPQG
jgi:hypothetical protein